MATPAGTLPNQPQFSGQGERSPQEAMLQMSMGFVVMQCLYAAAKLGIADLLKDGPKHCDELAAITETHSESLYRLLRALVGIGVFSETDPRCFQLTPLAECLEDKPGSVRNFFILRAELQYASWGNVMHSLRTGQSAFEDLHGMNLFQYMQQHPDAGEIFDRAMTELSAGQYAAILGAYDFSSIETLVDIGGGRGSLLTAVLQRYPALKGILFEQPQVIENARQDIENAGLIDRCELIGGNFFEALPSGANAYMFKNILIDWDDQNAITILRNCRQAMAEGGRVLVLERIISAEKPRWTDKFSDLNMLVWMPSGRVRTADEMRALFKAAGLELANIIPTKSIMSVLEGVAAS